MGSLRVLDVLWGHVPPRLQLASPGGRVGDVYAHSAAVPPLVAPHRYLVFLTSRAPYVSYATKPSAVFVFVPQYGATGAWVNPNGEVIVDVAGTEIVVGGRRPDLVPQLHPGVRLMASDPEDVVPMDPERVRIELQVVVDALRAQLAEPDALPVDFRPRRQRRDPR